jgi:large repetitive protein
MRISALRWLAAARSLPLHLPDRVHPIFSASCLLAALAAGSCGGHLDSPAGGGGDQASSTAGGGDRAPSTGGGGVGASPNPLCANGVLDPGEDCEDGNRKAGDGCDENCRYEPDRWKSCGNGRIDALFEQCDDGNTRPGDGCDSHCCTEVFWDCRVYPPCGCGNGILERREECDDGNSKDGDGCSMSCRIEPSTCGNGFIDGDEACDDGNREGGDGCSSACQLDTCVVPPGICGNAELEVGESCDDGNTLSSDGCDRYCRIEPGFVCPVPGKPCEAGSPPAERCGNGTIDPGELCDEGTNEGGYGNCSPNCAFGPRCGDGVIQAEYGEECDGPSSTCDASCRLRIPGGVDSGT